jgi:Na+-transporting NADH:ubiquinone oxidoreductase subunit C
MYSNSYIFRYAAILVILVAAVLSAAAILLKPAQDKNVAVAKMQGILAAINVEATSTDAINLYKKYIIDEEVLAPDGTVESEYSYKDNKFSKGDERAFDINLKEEQFKQSKGQPFSIPLYIAVKDNDTIYIIPLLGKGLWGPIWGNIALASDMNTVVGAAFDDKGETPGLGAEIAHKPFQEQFVGKKIFDDKGNFVSIKVVKGGVKMLPENQQIHGVDAVSGGTITSHGVQNMLQADLSNYIEYFKKHKH